MLMMDLNFWLAGLYIVVFLAAAFRAGEFQWLWASVLLWLGVGIIGAKLLPGIWGITRLSPLYLPHLYVTLGSLFFFLNRWKKTEQPGGWHFEGGSVFLSLFAVSNVLLSLVFLLFGVMVWYQFPNGITAYIAAAMLNIYVLKPGYWFIAQAVLMSVFYLHRSVIMKQSPHYFSSKQLNAGLMLAALFQTASIVLNLLEVRY
ncbi:membrane protein [Neisseria weaveri]|uniref:Membrane protein n=2 Tax=Neisseria weaveri TaxID=28091 RepID=A0A448VHY9_9NEIS|nr:hypothetical protein l11_13340 [Neisseria weaveri LMG 5135]SAY50983.1 membrane protein [Neisseria weaveri]VEJ49402.1 membrane protein [Neisseria weaveri]